MATLSPCESLNSKIDTLMSEFNTSTGKINTAVYTLNETLDTMKTQVGITDLESKINSARNTSSSELGNVLNSATSLTGSCLDSVMSSAFGVLNDASSYSSNIFGSIDGIANVSTLMQNLGNVKSLVDGLGIPKLLEKIDKTLGCLADNNDCIPTDKIETILTSITGTLETNGLGDTGMFDISKLLDNIPDFDSVLKQNVLDLDSAADSLAAESKQTIEQSLKTVSKYYDISKW
jgi:cell division protein ZapA (FtsZ GTPase activity inhibitor)